MGQLLRPAPALCCAGAVGQHVRSADMQPGSLCGGEFAGMPPQFAAPARSILVADYPSRAGRGCTASTRTCTATGDPAQPGSYYGMMSPIDYEIGRILEYLDDAGLPTTRWSSSPPDHGHFLGQHGLIAKGAFHYGMCCVPMIVRMPGQVPAGQVSGVCRAGRLPADLPGSGRHRRAGHQRRASTCFDVWVWAVPPPHRDHALVENRHNPTTVHLRTLITERYKITVYRNAAYGELFDLESDRQEVRNRWDDPAYAAVEERIAAQVRPGGNPARTNPHAAHRPRKESDRPKWNADGADWADSQWIFIRSVIRPIRAIRALFLSFVLYSRAIHAHSLYRY